jgi:predicted GNAT superfamily acetyltransferase
LFPGIGATNLWPPGGPRHGRNIPAPPRGGRLRRPVPSGVTFRELRTHAEYVECVAIQKETWGAAFSDVVPPSILKVSQEVGGITAGAFTPDGRMVGFIYGITGFRDGKRAHWSDMLAVRNDLRDGGLGRRLKWYQRGLLLKRGVNTMFWTFDPLVARNAHLNLNRLGAEIHEYVPDYYGPETDSDLHRGLGTDRFVVVWRLGSPRTLRARAGKPVTDYRRAAAAPVVNTFEVSGVGIIPEERELPKAPIVRIEVPIDIQDVKRDDPGIAWQWRTVTRRAFAHYLGKGYRVDGLYRDADGRAFYVLATEKADKPQKKPQTKARKH